MKRKDVLSLSDTLNNIIDILNGLSEAIKEKVSELEEIDSELMKDYCEGEEE